MLPKIFFLFVFTHVLSIFNSWPIPVQSVQTVLRPAGLSDLVCSTRPWTKIFHLIHQLVTGFLWEHREPKNIWAWLQKHKLVLSIITLTFTLNTAWVWLFHHNIPWGKKYLIWKLILYICPLTKKLSVYHFNGRFLWTVREKNNKIQVLYWFGF